MIPERVGQLAVALEDLKWLKAERIPENLCSSFFSTSRRLWLAPESKMGWHTGRCGGACVSFYVVYSCRVLAEILPGLRFV